MRNNYIIHHRIIYDVLSCLKIIYVVYTILYIKSSPTRRFYNVRACASYGVQNDNSYNNYIYTYNIGEYPSAKLRVFMRQRSRTSRFERLIKRREMLFLSVHTSATKTTLQLEFLNFFPFFNIDHLII